MFMILLQQRQAFGKGYKTGLLFHWENKIQFIQFEFRNIL